MIEIIEATTQDLPLVRRLADQTFHVTYLPLQPKEKVDYLFGRMYSLSSLSEQIEKGHQFILAKDETGYLGFASYELNCKHLPATKIHKLYVLPTAQGKGVGRLLIEKIADFGHQNKNQILSLNVFRRNPAIEFYQKLGFKIMKEEDVDVGNGITMNDFVMEKKIG